MSQKGYRKLCALTLIWMYLGHTRPLPKCQPCIRTHFVSEQDKLHKLLDVYVFYVKRSSKIAALGLWNDVPWCLRQFETRNQNYLVQQGSGRTDVLGKRERSGLQFDETSCGFIGGPELFLWNGWCQNLLVQTFSRNHTRLTQLLTDWTHIPVIGFC